MSRLTESTISTAVSGYNKVLGSTIKRTQATANAGCPSCEALKKLGGRIICGSCQAKKKV